MNYENLITEPAEYTFVFIKSRDHPYYHPILVEHDLCNDSFCFKQSDVIVYDKTILIDPLDQQKYLIQTSEMGNFGYYSVGNPIHIFENQVEVELDIYHYYFMQFCR